MAANPTKKASAEQRALSIHDRLLDLKPQDLTERQWALKAGVSSSFFTNLRGNGIKPPSEPSLTNLAAVLRVIDVTLPEFFLDEGHGRVVRNPPEADTIEAYRDLVDRLPKGADAAARFLNRNVRKLLGIPPGPGAIADPQSEDAPAEAAPAR